MFFAVFNYANKELSIDDVVDLSTFLPFSDKNFLQLEHHSDIDQPIFDKLEN